MNSKLDAYTADIIEALKNNVSQRKLAEQYGVARSTLQSFLESRNITDLVDIPDITREQILEQQLSEVKQSVRRTTKFDVQNERIINAIEAALDGAAVEQLASLPASEVQRPGEAFHRQAVLLSDWHAGEVVLPEQVGGLNEFNWDVLESRVQQTVDGLLSFKEVRPELTGLDVWALGDMVSGNIHEELTATNQFPAAEQAVRVGGLLADAITQLAPHYPDIHISGIAGNHARTKPQHASKNVFDSWDWVAYQLAKGLTSAISNVTWDIPQSGSVVRTVAGLDYLLFHGDGIRSSMPGVPWGGLLRRWNELFRQYAQEGHVLHGGACGHWHTACAIRRGQLLVNGSLIGTNEYGYKNFGGGEAASQILLTFDEKHNRLADIAFITPDA